MKRVKSVVACFLCGQTSKTAGALSKCSKCQNAYYCSKDCQVQHWGIHKVHCGHLPKIIPHRRERFREVNKTYRASLKTCDKLNALLEVIRTLLNSNDLEQAEKLLKEISVSRKDTPASTKLEYFDLCSRLAYSRYLDDRNKNKETREESFQRDMVRHALTAVNITGEELHHLTGERAVRMAERRRTLYENLWKMTDNLSYKKQATIVSRTYKLHTLDAPEEKNQHYVRGEKRILEICQSGSTSLSDFEEARGLLQQAFCMSELSPEECKYTIYNALMYVRMNSHHFGSDELFVQHLHKMREFGSVFNYNQCEEVALQDMLVYYSLNGMQDEEADARRALLNLIARANGMIDDPLFTMLAHNQRPIGGKMKRTVHSMGKSKTIPEKVTE